MSADDQNRVFLCVFAKQEAYWSEVQIEFIGYWHIQAP